MVPTPAGERLLVAARRALPQLSDVEEELRRLAGGRAAILRVSTECYTCYHWLPGVLQRFARRFPQVDVQIVAEATHHPVRSEEHTSELQSRLHLVCRLLLEKKKQNILQHIQI